jgi:hypothetical protein
MRIFLQFSTPSFLTATEKIKTRTLRERRASMAVSVVAGLYHVAEPME